VDKKDLGFVSLALSIVLGFAMTLFFFWADTLPPYLGSHLADTIALFFVVIPCTCGCMFAVEKERSLSRIKEHGVPFIFGASLARAYVTESGAIEIMIVALLATLLSLLWLALWYHFVLVPLADRYAKKGR
jgi:hypothetical protein